MNARVDTSTKPESGGGQPGAKLEFSHWQAPAAWVGSVSCWILIRSVQLVPVGWSGRPY